MAQPVVILEVNEIPLRVFRKFAELRPGSWLDRLMKSGLVLETLAQDVDETFLYPSQTWASLNTGAPYEAHRIHWYNDPKPAGYPLYWKTIADKGFKVGVVGTLHSSPAAAFAESNENVKFVIPDCFAPDTYTKPAYLEPFQSLTVKAVSANARVAEMKAPLGEAAWTVLNAGRYGIRAQTLLKGAFLTVQILRKKVNRERLRNLQFPLSADIFLRQVRKYQPDLAVLFTNHVAANMHRYWYGLFPEDYPREVYDQAWRDKYKDEINHAVDLLDEYVGRLMHLAESTGRMLVIVSSMGQHANQKLTPEFRQEHSIDYRLQDVKKFVSWLLKGSYSYQVESAMVPQYVLAFRNAAEAERATAEMEAMKPSLEGIRLTLDRNEEVVTISALLDPGAAEFRIGGQARGHKELGFVRLEVDDHHSGCHCPEGSLLVYNSRTSRAERPSINYLEYAPALLRHFGIERAEYMLEPSFSF